MLPSVASAPEYGRNSERAGVFSIGACADTEEARNAHAGLGRWPKAPSACAPSGRGPRAQDCGSPFASLRSTAVSAGGEHIGAQRRARAQVFKLAFVMRFVRCLTSLSIVRPPPVFHSGRRSRPRKPQASGAHPFAWGIVH